MGLSNHALIGLMFLALVGLGSAFPSDQEQKDETTNEDLMRPAYFDYDEASLQDSPAKRMPYIVHKRMPYIVHKRMPYIVHKRMPYIVHKRLPEMDRDQLRRLLESMNTRSLRWIPLIH